MNLDVACIRIEYLDGVLGSFDIDTPRMALSGVGDCIACKILRFSIT